MNIVVSIPASKYHMIIKNKKGNIKYKWYDEGFGKLYYDIPNRDRVNVGDTIFFFMYGCIHYYAIITEIQLRLMPERTARIYFDEVIEIKDKMQYRLKHFQGVRYIQDHERTSESNN